MQTSSSAPQAQDHKDAKASTNTTEEAIPQIHGFDEPLIRIPILEYIGGDISTKTCNTDQRNRFRLFSQDIHQLCDTPLRIFPHLLAGNETAFALATERPDLLHRRFDAKDPLGRLMRGKTLIHWAAALNDVTPCKSRQDETECAGMVERFAKIVGHDIVAQQLSEQFPGGWAGRDTRTPRIFTAFETFAESLISMDMPENLSFRAAYSRIQPIRIIFINALTTIFQEEITEGFIHNPQIFSLAIEYIQNNIRRFGGWISLKSDLVCVAGYGLLQRCGSERDNQFNQCGVYHVINNSFARIPIRPLDHPVSSCIDLVNISGLGADHFCHVLGPISSWATSPMAKMWYDTWGLHWENFQRSKMSMLCQQSRSISKSHVNSSSKHAIHGVSMSSMT